MTRPEDVALLRRVADLLPPISYEHTAAELRSLASRLEGERRDGERIAALEARIKLLDRVIVEHHASHIARGWDGPLCPVCTTHGGLKLFADTRDLLTPTTPTEDRPS